MSRYFYFWEEESGLKGKLARSLYPGPTAPEFTFITGLTERLLSIASTASHIYWSSNQTGGSPTPKISRAKSDGTEVEKEFITFPAEFNGYKVVAAVDETYIYWVKAQGGEHSKNFIGRAKLDGSERNDEFIKLPNQFVCLAIAVDKTHIYWVGEGPRGINRALLNGTGVEEEWVKSTNKFEHIALDSEYAYVISGSELGRAKLSNAAFEPEWISPLAFEAQGMVADTSHIFIVAWNKAAEKAYITRINSKTKLEEAEWLEVGTIFKGMQPSRLALSPEGGEPPVLKNPGTQTNHVGESVSLPIEATNTTEYKATGLPKGLSINESNGKITGTPTTIESTTVSLTVKGPGGSASGEFTWNIIASANTGDQYNYRGEHVNLQITPSGINYKATGLPPGLSINTLTGVVTGTPTTLGSYAVTVVIS